LACRFLRQAVFFIWRLPEKGLRGFSREALSIHWILLEKTFKVGGFRPPADLLFVQAATKSKQKGLFLAGLMALLFSADIAG